MVINVYCNSEATSVQWDNSYLPHIDTDGKQYYQVTMTSTNGCAAMQTDRYWYNLKELKYVFALAGLVGGIMMCVAGRLFLSYMVFISVVGSVIAASNLIAYTIAGGLSSFVFWLTFVTGSVCGLLLAWAFSKYRVGGAVVLAGWAGFEIGVAFSNLFYF